jgi:hypothetical protein
MAKITSKASLVLGTNLKLHVADKGGTDIAISKAGAVLTITSSTTNFTGSSEAGGIVNRALAIGDVITLSHTGNADNEGVTATLTAAGANSLTATIVSGTGATETAGADINIVAFKKQWQYLAAGGLSFIDGVQGIILASKMVDLWDASDLDKYDPAFTSIEPRAKSIAAINGWEPYDASTTNANRDTAMEIRPTKTAAATKIYALLRSTSNAHTGTDQITYWYGGDAEMTAPNNFVMTGYANQNVLIYDYNGGSPIDKRGTWYTRLAVEGKTIVMEQHSLNYAEIYPISAANAIDPKLVVADATIAAGGIFANIDFNLDADSVYVGDVNGSNYNFYGFIDGDTQANEAVHQKMNYLWRQPTDVNSDATGPDKRGDKQWPITFFSGDAFTVKSYLLNYKASQRNNLTLVDNTLVNRAWPAIYSLTVTAPALAIGGTMSLIHKDSHGTAAPVYLKNEANADQKDIAIIASRDIVIAYSTYNNGGHTPNTPIDLVLTWNRPSYIEPDNTEFTQGAANGSQAITPTADPSYTAA